MHKMVVVGGVAAGATAAAAARRFSKDVDITVLEAGPDVSFANCGLPYYIGGDIQSRSKLILQSPEGFKDQYDVDVKIQTEVTSINREAQTVAILDKNTGTQSELSYDSLILAQGGKPLVPPIPGADQDHVFSLWTLGDMDAIDNYIDSESPQTAVIVGGGFIGLEMAEALTKRGIAVSIVERLPQVMPSLEPEMAGFLTRELASYGIRTLTGRAVTQVRSGEVVLDNQQTLPAQLVLMSVGVRPTLQLAQDAGLEIGDAGGLLVDEYLTTSDPKIFAAGDMVEIVHRTQNGKVRIPLAGPANRQGRLAAVNALGGRKSYAGSLGTSIVRVFDAVAGSTGLSLSRARSAGIPADAVVIHKEHHTSYYPGAEQVSVLVVYNRDTGVVLGGQTAGFAGADRRLDVLATAAAAGMTVSDLAELDLAYAPPLGTPNDPVNMAAFTAENRMTGYSPSLTAAELDAWIAEKSPVVLDLRDAFVRSEAFIQDSLHIPLTLLPRRMDQLDPARPLLLVSDDGKKAHQVLRRLVQAGFSEVMNASGGYISLERHARSVGFSSLDVGLFEPEDKLSAAESNPNSPASASTPASAQDPLSAALSAGGPVVVDVRTPEEFAGGAYPDALNIPLDELGGRISEFGDPDREIVVYCASGARSAYAQRLLMQAGYTRVRNGGGIMDMLYR